MALYPHQNFRMVVKKKIKKVCFLFGVFIFYSDLSTVIKKQSMKPLKDYIMNPFTSVRRKLNDVPRINQGGCGISALAMYRWLEKENKLVGDEKFIYLYYEHDEFYDANMRVFENKDFDELTSCCHVLLLHNGHYYDSNSKRNKKELEMFFILQRLDFESYHHEISKDIILGSINNVKYWHPNFEREFAIPEIENEIGVDLSDVSLEKEHFFW